MQPVYIIGVLSWNVFTGLEQNMQDSISQASGVAYHLSIDFIIMFQRHLQDMSDFSPNCAEGE